MSKAHDATHGEGPYTFAAMCEAAIGLSAMWSRSNAEALLGLAEIGREAVLAKASAISAPQVTDEMVNRFLSWKLPEDFHPDAGISFSPYFNVEYNAKQGMPPRRHEPIGTNLLTATQARAMLEHVLSAVSETPQKPADPSGDLMILRMALGNTAACLGDALATYNRFVGEEVFKNTAPQSSIATVNAGLSQAAVAAPETTLSTIGQNSDPLSPAAIMEQASQEQKPDPIAELCKSIRNDIRLCDHGYIHITCGQCVATWMRG